MEKIKQILKKDKKDLTINDCVNLLIYCPVKDLKNNGIDVFNLENFVMFNGKFKTWDNFNPEHPYQPYWCGIIWNGRKIATEFRNWNGLYFNNDQPHWREME